MVTAALTTSCSPKCFKNEVRRLTGGRGVDVIVDPVGGDRFTDSLRSLAREGLS
jgi:NADPH:quinone reductase-like Zn-dependent oxidoreductase